MDASMLLQITLWGLYAGCIYILIAIGLNLIFGVMKVVNFAHGEFLMLAAYATFWLTTYSGLNPYYVVPASMLLLAMLGVLVERLLFRPIRGTGKLNEIFLSIGLIYLFQNVAAVLWTTNTRSVRSPFADDSVNLGTLKLPFDYLMIILLTVFLLSAFYLFMRKTKTGRAMRATSQNREAAELMGINVGRMDMASFAIGSALAAAAGSLWVISGQLVSPYMGSILSLKGFAVVIIGGLGSIPGAVIAGLLLGLAENILPFIMQMAAGAAGYDASFTAWKDTIAFFVLITVLVVRPTGLFGEEGE
jgi:branched-chain amino acid transport system permease protein